MNPGLIPYRHWRKAVGIAGILKDLSILCVLALGIGSAGLVPADQISSSWEADGMIADRCILTEPGHLISGSLLTSGQARMDRDIPGRSASDLLVVTGSGPVLIDREAIHMGPGRGGGSACLFGNGSGDPESIGAGISGIFRNGTVIAGYDISRGLSSRISFNGSGMMNLHHESGYNRSVSGRTFLSGNISGMEYLFFPG